MIRRPPRSTRTDTLFPYTTLFRSKNVVSDTLIGTGKLAVSFHLTAADQQRVVELEGPSRKRSEKSGPRAGRVEVRAQLLGHEADPVAALEEVAPVDEDVVAALPEDLELRLWDLAALDIPEVAMGQIGRAHV